jgi:HEAT repeat protein
MLADVGPAGGRELKRALALEVTVEQRFRIMEILDLVTRDVKDVIAYSLEDANPKIRRAAFRLAERVSDDAIIEVILPFAHHEDLAVTKGTIRSLAQMGSVKAAQAVVAILEKTREPDLAIVCCQALGQIADPASVEALVRALNRRGRFWVGRWWSGQVRATAALALAQIPHQWAKQALKKFLQDPEPRVQQIASSRAEAEANESAAEARDGLAPSETQGTLQPVHGALTELQPDPDESTPESSKEEAPANESQAVTSPVSR